MSPNKDDTAISFSKGFPGCAPQKGPPSEGQGDLLFSSDIEGCLLLAPSDGTSMLGNARL